MQTCRLKQLRGEGKSWLDAVRRLERFLRIDLERRKHQGDAPGDQLGEDGSIPISPLHSSSEFVGCKPNH